MGHANNSVSPLRQHRTRRHPSHRFVSGKRAHARQMPPIEQPVTSRIGYHIRSGGHDVTNYDWERFMDFADKHMVPKSTSEDLLE